MTEKYQHLQPLEHFLKCTAMYMGAVEAQPTDAWILQDGRAMRATISLCPAARHMVNEALNNACDNIARGTKNIDVALAPDCVRITNDGPTIIIQRKPEWDNQWVPEGVFTRFGSGENFSHGDYAAGKHGYGIKGATALSKRLDLTCSDGMQLYTQTFENNMSLIHPPVIEKKKQKAGTSVTFYPDFTRFKDVTSYEPMLAEMMLSVYRAAAFYPATKFVLNGAPVAMTLAKYAALFTTGKVALRKAEIEGESLQYAFFLHTNGLQESCVNGVHTPAGGPHVHAVFKGLIKGFQKQTEATTSLVEGHVMLICFYRAKDPKFGAQAKTALASPLSKALLEALDADLSVYFGQKDVTGITQAINEAKARAETKALKRAVSTSKRADVPGLMDAGKAGKKGAEQCALFIVEGVSALNMFAVGAEVIGTEFYGAMPVRGKMKNVHGMPMNTSVANMPCIGDIGA